MMIRTCASESMNNDKTKPQLMQGRRKEQDEEKTAHVSVSTDRYSQCPVCPHTWKKGRKKEEKIKQRKETDRQTDRHRERNVPVRAAFSKTIMMRPYGCAIITSASSNTFCVVYSRCLSARSYLTKSERSIQLGGHTL